MMFVEDHWESYEEPTLALHVLHDDGTTAAIEGNIRPGDKVVVEGQLRVVDGGTVAVNKNGHHTPAPHTPVGAQ